MPVSVRPYRPPDLSAIERITTAAYGRAMSPPMAVRIAMNSGGVFVAEIDGNVAGNVLAVRYGAHAYVASMAVDPARRRQGVGRALMTGLIDDLEASGVASMELDATDAGAPLYEQFGFVDTDRTAIVERDVALDGPNVAGSDVDCDAPAFASALNLDRMAMGCDRATALRGFARLPDAHLTSIPGAYALSRGDVLGPWIATSPEAAGAALEKTLAARTRVARAFVPASNEAARALVTESGFAATRFLRHMTRGMSPMRREFVYGQASLGHG